MPPERFRIDPERLDRFGEAPTSSGETLDASGATPNPSGVTLDSFGFIPNASGMILDRSRMILNASRTPPDASGITPDADRSTPIAAKQRGEDFGRLKYAEEEELVLSRLPCWADLTPEQYRERIAELVEEIDRVPGGRGEAQSGKPDGQVPSGVVPAGPSLRERLQLRRQPAFPSSRSGREGERTVLLATKGVAGGAAGGLSQGRATGRSRREGFPARGRTGW